MAGSDSKKLGGGIKMSGEKEGAEKMLLEAAGDTADGTGETSSSEKGDIPGITETAGTSYEGLAREELETFANIESKVWQPTIKESCPPCGQDVLEEKAGMTITHNPNMRLFINVNPFLR
jgi:hypothetical protein